MTDPAVVAALAGALGGRVGITRIFDRGHPSRARSRPSRARGGAGGSAATSQQLTDQRAAFQRDTILALQDAIGEMWALSADAYNRAAALAATTGTWPAPDHADLPDLNTTSARITALRARIFDDDLRLLVRELQTSIWSALEVSDWSTPPERMVAARDPMNLMQERVNVLLRELS
jgi:hypothetical protein